MPDVVVWAVYHTPDKHYRCPHLSDCFRTSAEAVRYQASLTDKSGPDAESFIKRHDGQWARFVMNACRRSW